MKKDKQVLKMLKQDMDKRNIPDFWDKIQEQKQISPPPPKLAFHQTSQSTNNTLKLLSIAAAAVFIFGVIPVIVLNIISGFPFIPGGQRPSAATEKDFNYYIVNDLEQKQIYGKLSPSTKTPDELLKILSSLEHLERVYEDDKYIYRFDVAGNLTEMVCKDCTFNSSKNISQEDIDKIVDNILETYFPLADINFTQKSIYQDSDMNWNIEFTNYYSAFGSVGIYWAINIDLTPDGQIIKLERISSS